MNHALHEVLHERFRVVEYARDVEEHFHKTERWFVWPISMFPVINGPLFVRLFHCNYSILWAAISKGHLRDTWLHMFILNSSLQIILLNRLRRDSYNVKQQLVPDTKLSLFIRVEILLWPLAVLNRYLATIPKGFLVNLLCCHWLYVPWMIFRLYTLSNSSTSNTVAFNIPKWV